MVGAQEGAGISSASTGPAPSADLQAELEKSLSSLADAPSLQIRFVLAQEASFVFPNPRLSC
jgi:hypothetical protein